MIDDKIAKNRRKQQQKENIYDKYCIICHKPFASKGKEPVGTCPDCSKERYCDRCCQEISYYEYMTNGGLCNECAELVEFGDDEDND